MTQLFSFNLVDEPWIPCIWSDGKLPEALSLRETLLHAHQLQEIMGDVPPVTAALYRLLLAILHDEFGPKNRDTWRQMWRGKHFEPERINKYLDANKSFFDLFDKERPFYQSADLDKVENPAVRLFHHVNSPTLFEHSTAATGTFTPAQAARGLVTLQAFALAQGPNFRPASDSTWARDVIFILQGENLFETLLLNLIAYPYQRPIPSSPKDAPSWRMPDPFKPERSTPLGYLDYLTWQNRRILLLPENRENEVVVNRMLVLPGYRLDLGPTTPDPFKLYFLKREQDSYYGLRFKGDRALWRDSTALLSVHKITEAQEKSSMIPPYTFQWIYGLRDALTHKGMIYHYSALGMGTDNPPQNKVFFYRHEQLPLHLEYLNDEGLVMRLQESLALAEKVASEIQWAARKLIILIQYPELEQDEKIWRFLNEKVIKSRLREALWGKLKKERYQNPILDIVNKSWGIDRSYWAELETPFLQLTLNLPNFPDTATFEWEISIKRAARRAFDLAREMAGLDTKALRAVVIAEKELNIGLKLTLPHLA